MQQEFLDQHNSQQHLNTEQINDIKELEEELTRYKHTTRQLMNKAANILHKQHPKQTKQNKETANKLKHLLNREQKECKNKTNT